MRKDRFGRGFITGAVLTLGLVLTMGAKPWDARPFLGTSEGTSQVTGITAGIVSAVSTGTINATHIGEGTYTATTTHDYPRHLEQDHPFGNCAFVNGMIEITAANGDVINGDLDGDRSVVCAPDEQGPVPPAEGDVYVSTLFIHVTGGTGRFADATGWLFSEGTSTLQEDPSMSVDEADIFGDIDY